jgi:hypothetical protein
MPFTPFKLNLFLLKKIPIAWLAGIRVKKISDDETVISLKYHWLNQNPFRSVYFGVLIMAGELSTGIPLFTYLKRKNLNMSMLVVAHHSIFHKKATGRITYTFSDYETVKINIDKAVATGESVKFDLKVSAINENGEKVADFSYTWSVKQRK